MLNLDLPEELIEELAKIDHETWHSRFKYTISDWKDIGKLDQEAYRRSALAVVKRFLEYVDEQ